MARKLNRNVTVSDPETGQSATFGPGDEVPEWAEKRITAEGVWEGDDVAEPDRPRDPGNSGVSRKGDTSETAEPVVADVSDEGGDEGASARRRGR